jgi:hypothetical protein
MPVSSLGYHNTVNSATRANQPSAVRVSVPPAPAPPSVRKSRRERVHDVATAFGGSAGVLTTLLFAGVFLTLPLLHFYVTVDYSQGGEKAGVVGLAAGAALLPIIAQDAVAWYNMVLFFHIGVEARLLDILFQFARTNGIPDGEMVMAWLGFGVIIAHLVPFLLVDYKSLLCLLAAVGVGVNTSVAVYLEPSLVLLAFLSSFALLQTSLCVLGCKGRASLVSAFLRSTKTGKWIGCAAC